jgi:hypothetical protein
MRKERRRARLALTAAFVSLAAAGATQDELAPPRPTVAITPGTVEGLEEYACAACHSEVAAEWAVSAHGLAWVDEAYQAALRKKRRRAKGCHGCHVPTPLLAGELARRATPRTEDLHLGITCEACHLGEDDVILGPRGTETEAHASRTSRHMWAPGSDDLCIVCHATTIGPVIGIAKDFRSRGQAERGLSCVGCHMAPVERRWADGDEVPIRLGRSHALQTPRDPAFLRRAFELAWSDEGEHGRIVITNRAGHQVPGLEGRELRFRAEVLDADGSSLGTAELVLDTVSFLPANDRVELRLTAQGAAVHVVGDHVDPRSEEPVRFLDERLVPAR